MDNLKHIPSVCFFIPVIFFCSCGPVIYSFTADQYTITKDDSVQLRWKVSGIPVLLVHIDTAVSGNSDDAQNETRNFKLVVQKNGKEKSSTIAVNVLPVESADDIILPVVKAGDSLVARGEKNLKRWGSHFLLKTVSSTSGRDINITHGGKTFLLGGDGKSSAAFSGLPNSGNWNIASLMTPEEKKDSTLIPPRFILHSIIIHQK